MENNEIMINEEIEVMDNNVDVVVEADEKEKTSLVPIMFVTAVGTLILKKGIDEGVKIGKELWNKHKAKSEAKKEAKKHKNDNVIDVEPQEVEEVVDNEETSEEK